MSGAEISLSNILGFLVGLSEFNLDFRGLCFGSFWLVSRVGWDFVFVVESKRELRK